MLTYTIHVIILITSYYCLLIIIWSTMLSASFLLKQIMLLNRVCLLALSILVVGHTSSANQYVTDHYIYWSNASIQSPSE